MQHVLTMIIILIAVTCTVIGMAIATTFPEYFLMSENGNSAAFSDQSPAAAFQVLMACHGIDRGEDEWAAALFAVPANLTVPEKMAVTARSCGLSAEVEQGLTLGDLKEIISDNGPVIAVLDERQYIVVTAVSGENVTLGSGINLSDAEFEAEWAGGECLVLRDLKP
jgi:ABC-type bacteriocin/lantibiotic exporter with double-glycine peptidase domain